MSGIEAALFGVLGRDAERKTSKAGKPYLRFTVRIGDGDGVQWVSVLCFDGSTIEVADKMVAGARVYVEGILKLDEWTAQDGTKAALAARSPAFSRYSALILIASSSASAGRLRICVANCWIRAATSAARATVSGPPVCAKRAVARRRASGDLRRAELLFVVPRIELVDRDCLVRGCRAHPHFGLAAVPAGRRRDAPGS